MVATSIAYAAGAPSGTLRTASQVALVPTWFLAAYVVVRSACPPATLWLWERRGWWSVVGGLLLGGVVDLVSLGTDTLWVGLANYLVVWATVHQLGYAWLDGRLAGTGRAGCCWRAWGWWDWSRWWGRGRTPCRWSASTTRS